MTCAACQHPGGLALTDLLLAAAALPAAADVLDVGCGLGATIAHVADDHGLHATGVDASCERVRAARRSRPDLTFVAGRAESLPFAADAFDAVLCECVLSTLAEPCAALAEVVRVLRPGGAVLLSDLYVREGRETSPSGPPTLGRRASVERLLEGAELTPEVWGDRSESLGRYLWDRAGSRSPSTRAAARRQSPSSTGRRLGYFYCLARLSGAPERSIT